MRLYHGAFLLIATTPLGFAACGDDPVGPDAPFARVETVTLDVDSVLLPGLGFSTTLSATALDAAGQPVDVPMTWGSRSPSVAGADGSGRVIARGYGTASVVASVGSAVDTATVVVRQIPETIEITGAVDTIFAVGSETRAFAFAYDSAGAAIEDADGTWTVSSPAVLSINEFGRVGAVGVGSALITWSFRGVSASKEITVVQTPEFFWVWSDADTLAPGETTRVYGIHEDLRGNSLPIGPVSWETSDSSIATVEGDGYVTAVGGGHVVLTGESAGFTNRLSLVVLPETPPPGTLVAGPGPLLGDAYGHEFVLQSNVDDGLGDPVAVPATWTSRDTDVAEVRGPIASARFDGETWLVAEYDGRVDSIRVTVARIPARVSFQGRPRTSVITLTEGSSVYPLATDRNGVLFPGNLPIVSRDTTIVRITTSGYAGQRKGETWVVAEGMGVRDSIHVTVLPEHRGGITIQTVDDLAFFAAQAPERLIGMLRVDGTALTHLDGLESLEWIEGDVLIRLNDDLVDIGGLSGLRTVTGTVTIETNASLAQPSLPALRRVGALSVFRNAGLDGAMLFPALETVKGIAYLENKGVAATFPALRSAGSIRVFFNGPVELSMPELESIEGGLHVVDVLETVTVSAPRLWRVGELLVRGNASLRTLSLPELTTIVEGLEVVTSPALTDLDDMSVTSGILTVRIRQNASLSSLDGLVDVGSAIGADPVVPDGAWIEYNPSMPQSVITDWVTVVDDRYVGDAFPGGFETRGNGGG